MPQFFLLPLLAEPRKRRVLGSSRSLSGDGLSPNGLLDSGPIISQNGLSELHVIRETAAI
jgi:hypothetical protein